MKNHKPGNDTGFEKTISYLLITGVIISLILEVIGVILFYLSSSSLDISHEPEVYIRGNNFFSFIFQQFRDMGTIKPAMLLMTLGIIVLILTPFIRVVASVVHFTGQKNLKYALITLFVLIVVTLSLALH